MRSAPPDSDVHVNGSDAANVDVFFARTFLPAAPELV